METQTQKKKPVVDMTPDERKSHVWTRKKLGILEVIVESYYGVADRVINDSRHKGLPQYVQSAAIATNFIKKWGETVGNFDNNNVKELGVSVRPVNKDKNLFESAIEEHAANPDVFEKALAAEYRDDEISGGETWADIGPIYWRNEIQKSNIPMLVFASWLDAGTVDGALLRYQNLNNAQNLILMASTHGGRYHASPYTVSQTPLPPQPSEFEQYELRRIFFDYHLKGQQNGVNDWAPIRFFNLGEEKYHTTNAWPPTDFVYG